MVELIFSNSQKLIDNGMSVNEVIKANSAFLKNAGLDSDSIVKIEIALKLELDADFKESYTEWVLNEM